MGSTSSSTWKRAESFAAGLFGAKRRPLSGSANRDDIEGDDAIHPRLWIESKLRERFAVWSLWRKTQALAKQQCPRIYQGGYKCPVLVLREKHREGALVVVHSNDLREMVLEYLAARTGDELNEIEAGVRVRRRGIDGDARVEAQAGREDRD